MTIQPRPRRGLALNFKPKKGDVTHEWCGKNSVKGADCPYCPKPLLRILTLSTADPLLEVEAAKTSAVHLLYCWTCSIPYGEFSYRIRPDASVELMQVPPVNQFAFGAAGPYDDYPGVFPGQKVALVPLSEANTKEQAKARQDEDTLLELLPGTRQLGGFPPIANPQEIACPSCAKLSPLLAMICDDASGNEPMESAPPTLSQAPAVARWCSTSAASAPS